MKPRQELSDIPPDTLTKLKAASLPPNKDPTLRFSKKQLHDQFGLSLEGGLVSIDGKIYVFMQKEIGPNAYDPNSYVLGEGGFGKVKLLQNIEFPFDQKALKVLNKKFFNLPEDKRQKEEENFKHELEIAKKLGRGFPYFIGKQGKDGKISSYCGVLDLAPGISLQQFIDNNALLDTKTCLEITLACFKETEMMHNNMYVHGDIKPNNFMYDSKTGQVKIIDFGQTKSIEDSNPAIDLIQLGFVMLQLFNNCDNFYVKIYADYLANLMINGNINLDKAKQTIQTMLDGYKLQQTQEVTPTVQQASSTSTAYLLSQHFTTRNTVDGPDLVEDKTHDEVASVDKMNNSENEIVKNTIDKNITNSQNEINKINNVSADNANTNDDKNLDDNSYNPKSTTPRSS